MTAGKGSGRQEESNEGQNVRRGKETVRGKEEGREGGK